jgi:hypothetical protein
MSDNPEQLPDVSTYTVDSDEESPKITRYMIIGLGALAGFIVVALIAAIIVGLTNSEGLASGFRIIRDFLIIVLALQGIFICLAMVVLILQLSSLINLLRNEVGPVIEELRETATTARGTAQFVSKNVASPVIKVASTAAGVRAFLGQLVGIRRNTTGHHALRNGRK